MKEHTKLIERLVKANPKFQGNEDLLEDFCSEVYQKSYLILQSIEDINSLEAYMRKVVSSSIIDVLRKHERLVRTTEGYRSIEKTEIVSDDIGQNSSYNQSYNKKYPNKPPVMSQDLLNIKDPRESIEEQVIRKDIIENIIDLVKQIEKEKPQEKFLMLFYSRYFLQMKQKEIAEEIGISQAEVSKRLVNLSQLIKEKLY